MNNTALRITTSSVRQLLAAIFLLAFAGLTPAMAATPATTSPTALASDAAAAETAVQATAQVTAQDVANAQPDVNINQAGAVELAESLVGVGPSKAQAIVAYRKQHGPFKSIDDLKNVKGIGPATFAKNKAHILLK